MIVRSVGIDFGTSSVKIAVRQSSVINNEIKDISPLEFVRFDNGSLKTPALIRKAGDKYLYGIDAEAALSEGTQLFSNFKEKLIDKNPDNRNQALCLIKLFFKYLYRKYQEQFGEMKCDKVVTYLSMPVYFDTEAASLMKEAAAAAGFSNVETVLEPIAAVRQILQEKSQLLSNNYYISEKRPASILVLDVGAAGARAYVCNYDYLKNEIKPVSYCLEKLAGGSELDSLLCSFFLDYLYKNGAETKILAEFKDICLPECRRFKENILMKNLECNISTDSCSFISGILSYMDNEAKPFPSINRNSFGEIFQDYIFEFRRLAGTVLEDSGDFSRSSRIDLAVLTGGSSSWYFIKDIISLLPQIKSDPKRLLISENPELTISAGLVWSGLKPDIKTEEKKVPKAPLQLQVKFRAEEDCTLEEKKELLTYLTGLDLNKEEYKIIYELYDSKKYDLKNFLYNTVNKNLSVFSDISLTDDYEKLLEDSGFAPLECMAALKHFKGNTIAAMKNFYAVSYLADEKEFQKEAYKMCLSKLHGDGKFARFLISAEEFINIKEYYMNKKNASQKEKEYMEQMPASFFRSIWQTLRNTMIQAVKSALSFYVLIKLYP